MVAAPTAVTDEEIWEYYEEQEDGQAVGAVC